MGVVDLDARIVAKYFSDFNVKQLYHMYDYATNIEKQKIRKCTL